MKCVFDHEYASISDMIYIPMFDICRLTLHALTDKGATYVGLCMEANKSLQSLL